MTLNYWKVSKLIYLRWFFGISQIEGDFVGKSWKFKGVLRNLALKKNKNIRKTMNYHRKKN